MMSDLKINGPATNAEFSQIKPSGKDPAGGFEDIMQEAIGKISQVQNDADTAVKELASGGDMTQAIIAMEKADMSFNMMVEVRNKLVNAYEEIMRMSV
jgi:flagellar hook-basal body complex protein FliE